MFTQETIRKFEQLPTPFYYYNTALLKKTLNEVQRISAENNFIVHYALKANSNPQLLNLIRSYQLGADCVSGNEVKRAIETGFAGNQIVFAGVGKSDQEINYALDQNILCFNVESLQEIEVINELSAKKSKTASIALRINPNVDAYTHKYITTGLEENKFGINPYEFDAVMDLIKKLPNIQLCGLHFHIGSQITDLSPFKKLCQRVNEINQLFFAKGFDLKIINMGGGLGINYREPDHEEMVDFKSFFEVFKQFLVIRKGQEIHFELGRAIVANCGSLISRVLYIKKAINTSFVILDAGMTELIRPALYQAYHKIENLSSGKNTCKYDVVGPICESSDCFGKSIELPETQRGDLIAIRSTGAYGEVMASGYNLRTEAPKVFSE